MNIANIKTSAFIIQSPICFLENTEKQHPCSPPTLVSKYRFRSVKHALMKRGTLAPHMSAYDPKRTLAGIFRHSFLCLRCLPPFPSPPQPADPHTSYLSPH